MPQKISSFLKQSWFPILTMIGMLIHGYYTMNYAQKDSAREISELQSDVKQLNGLAATVAVHTNDISEMKKFIFRSERAMTKFERNMDRMSWVVEELAKKEGITPPKTFHPDFE